MNCLPSRALGLTPGLCDVVRVAHFFFLYCVYVIMLCLVPDVTCVSGWSIPDFPFYSVNENRKYTDDLCASDRLAE